MKSLLSGSCFPWGSGRATWPDAENEVKRYERIYAGIRHRAGFSGDRGHARFPEVRRRGRGYLRTHSGAHGDAGHPQSAKAGVPEPPLRRRDVRCGAPSGTLHAHGGGQQRQGHHGRALGDDGHQDREPLSHLHRHRFPPGADRGTGKALRQAGHRQQERQRHRHSGGAGGGGDRDRGYDRLHLRRLGFADLRQRGDL